MSCAKTAEPIEMPFGADLCMSKEPCIGDAAFCQITLDTCYHHHYHRRTLASST